MTKAPQTGKALAQITDPAAKAVASMQNTGLGIQCQTFDDVWRMSQLVARSGFVPKGITTPEQVSVQIMMGMEIGLRPMVAIQNIAVINNKAAIPGDLALAILLTSGLLEEHDERIEGVGDERIGICTVKRKGMAKSIERRFSVADAIQAGLWETKPMVRKEWYDKALKKKVQANYETPNDSPWWKYQDRMLVMRARGFAFRDRFTDVLKGMHLTEEMVGHEFEEAEFTPAPGAVEGPQAPDEEIDEAEITRAQETAPRREAPPLAAQPDESEEEEAEEEFDGDAWLLERKVNFHEAANATVVDEIHEMFGETAETMLNADQRVEYEDMHLAAIKRFEKPAPAATITPPAGDIAGPDGPDDSEDGASDFPGNDAIREMQGDTASETDEVSAEVLDIRARVLAIKTDPNRTHTSLGTAFNAILPEIENLVADGDMPQEELVEIHADMTAEFKRLKKLSQDQVGGTGDPEADALTAEIREGLAKCETAQAVNDFATSMLPKRNKFGSKHPLYNVWKDMIGSRRKALAGIAG